MLTGLWDYLQAHPTVQYVGFSYWFPLLESIHVLAIAFLVGSIAVVDLRLLGLSGRRYAATRMNRELIPWAWGAFVVAVLTGFPLFATRAGAYAENPAFQIKFVFLALAGLNMLVFQLRTFRGITGWDTAETPPPAARLAGAMSLLFWAGVIFAGRWTGHII